jgi:hypothetical protein
MALRRVDDHRFDEIESDAGIFTAGKEAIVLNTQDDRKASTPAKIEDPPLPHESTDSKL